jgi:DNA-binding transcriptional LysR family regulator
MTSLAQLDLNALVLFDAVAQSGGFTSAAERLGVTKSKLSLQISRLEALLGSSLFTRTTRRVTLTEAGQALWAQCQPLLQGLQEVLDRSSTTQAGLTGTLRVTATVDHAAQSVAPAIARFMAQHPALQVDLRTGDRVVDMVGEGIDVAIRMGWLKDSTLQAVKLGSFQQYLVASPAYLKRAGRPQAPQDLTRHAWIALSLLPTPLTWKFTGTDGSAQTVQMRSRLRVDATGAMRTLLREGAGVSVLDEFSACAALRAGEVLHLLPDWTLPEGGLYAVFPPGRHRAAKSRAFVDFYRDSLSAPA